MSFEKFKEASYQTFKGGVVSIIINVYFAYLFYNRFREIGKENYRIMSSIIPILTDEITGNENSIRLQDKEAAIEASFVIDRYEVNETAEFST